MDDLISRQAAIDYFLEVLYDLDENDFVDKVFIEEKLKRVPSIQLVQKTGFWAYKESGIYYCSICGQTVMSDAISPYCPNCGAKMDLKEGESE